MYIDKNTLFSDQASVTATSTSAMVDLYPGYSGGNSPFITAYANSYGGTGSVEIQLETSASKSFANSRRVASFPISSGALAHGGEVLAVSLPSKVERYIRLKYVVSGSISGLKIISMLVLDIFKWRCLYAPHSPKNRGCPCTSHVCLSGVSCVPDTALNQGLLILKIFCYLPRKMSLVRRSVLLWYSTEI